VGSSFLLWLLNRLLEVRSIQFTLLSKKRKTLRVAVVLSFWAVAPGKRSYTII